MENLKFILITIVILAVLVVAGLWAFGTLESGEAHVSREEVQNLRKENQELKEEIEALKDELAVLKPAEEEVVEETPKEETKAPTPTTYKYQTLISELEKLVTDNIQMKVGSKGTRVGTIQNFLNLYFGTTKRVDNDYGKTTKTDVTNFQKKEGLTADGETGPTTYKKMIEWLKKQG